MVAVVHDLLKNSHLARRRVRRAALYDLGVAIATTVARWRRRVREREELARLDWRELKDIGLTEAEARWLIEKPIWRE